MRPAQLAADLAAVNHQQRRAAEFVAAIRHFAASSLRGIPAATLAERAGDHGVAQILREASPAARLSDLPSIAAAASAFASTMRGSSAVDAVLAGGAARVPWASRIGLATFSGGGTPAEGRAKPVGRLALVPDSMQSHKASSIAVLSEQLLTAIDYPAEAVRAELAGALANDQDGPFLQHLLSGVTPTPSTGDPSEDVYAALSSVARGSASRLVWLAGPDAHDQWQSLAPDLAPRALASVTRCDGVAAASLILIDAAQIAIADGGIIPDTASQASLELDDDPDGAADSPPAPSQLVSLWQTGSAAIRLERKLRYRRLRSSAVAVISNVDWIGAGSP